MTIFAAIPWNQLPMLEYDGKKIVQSIAMARFLAREYGLSGKNNLEAAQADMLVDCMSDLQNSEYPKYFFNINLIHFFYRNVLIFRVWTNLQGKG